VIDCPPGRWPGGPYVALAVGCGGLG